MRYSNEALRVADCIRTMRIRSTAGIARSLTRAFIIFAKSSTAGDINDYIDELNEVSEILLNTRPINISLLNGI